MDLVKVVNTGDTPLTLRHDDPRAGGDITIEPGSSRIVRGDYVALNFGNPGARNEGRNRIREADHKNLLTRWGFYSGLYPDAAWDGQAIVPSTGELVGPFKPQFECYTVTDSSEEPQRIWTILDDPEGTKQNPTLGAAVVGSTDIETLQAQIAEMAKSQAQLLNLVAQLSAERTERTPETDERPTVGVADPGNSNEPVGGDGTAQATRNEQRDQIPAPPAVEPPVTADRPRTRRVGG